MNRDTLRTKVWMSICNELSKLSTCQFTHVGALIVDPETNSIVAEGYNGTVSGKQHCQEMTFSSRDEHHDFATLTEIHAEINAINKAIALGKPLMGTYMYTKISPCQNCSDRILQEGISAVYYQDVYWRNPVLHHSNKINYHHVPESTTSNEI